MSGDQQVTSAGDSTAQPPTPNQTPASSTSFFSSPAFETPKISFANTTSTTPRPDSTPRFAHDFSVFNTPGNFRGSQGPYGGFVAPFTSASIPDTAAQPAPARSPSAPNHHKRLLSVASIAAEIASYPNHPPTSASSLPVPPVEPSRRLSSSPGSLVAAAFGSTSIQDNETTSIREQSPDYYSSVPNTGSPRATKAFKKARGDSAATPRTAPERPASASASASQGQTATPPPSARKGARKLAPKLQASTTLNMQSEQGFGPQHQQHPDYLTTPQQQQVASFATSPADLFGNFPMSAPATATAFSDAREFWGNADPNMMSMDVDYGANMFATPNTVQRQLDAIDWTQASQATQAYMLGSAGDMSHDAQRHMESHHLQHMSMAAEGNAKSMMPTTLDTVAASHHALYSGAYPTPVDDPFGMVNPNGSVNPGLLFSRPPSSSMDAMASAPSGAASSLSLAEPAMFDRQPHLPTTSAPGALQMTQSSPPPHMRALASENGRGDLRRSSSVRDMASTPRRKAGDRSSASSPVKSAARPGLSRSQSETRGPRLRGRASLPTLAPAIKAPALTTSQTVSSLCPTNPGQGITRSASFGGSRPTGRNSPIRMQQHQRQQQHQHQHQQQQLLQQQTDQHARLSSLTSIPEVNTPQAKASVKFMIDASGRARVEAGADDDEAVPQSTIRRNKSAHNLHIKSKWDSSTDEDSSSSDDEPIIIPSRTTSFALPDPVKPTIGRGPLHSSQRSISDRSTSSIATSVPGDTLFNDAESESETVNNDYTDGAGDAASELKKLRQMRQKQASLPAGVNSFAGGGNLFGSVQHGQPFGAPMGVSMGGPMGGPPGQHLSRSHSMQAVSPMKPTEASLLTPSTGSRSHDIRCICGRADAPPTSDGFIVQCESCDMWLHGRCINITKRTLPQVYICAFCAQTPTAHNVRMPASAAAASSPLAHKSFKTFR